MNDRTENILVYHRPCTLMDLTSAAFAPLRCNTSISAYQQCQIRDKHVYIQLVDAILSSFMSPPSCVCFTKKLHESTLLYRSAVCTGSTYMSTSDVLRKNIVTDNFNNQKYRQIKINFIFISMDRHVLALDFCHKLCS